MLYPDVWPDQEEPTETFSAVKPTLAFPDWLNLTWVDAIGIQSFTSLPVSRMENRGFYAWPQWRFDSKDILLMLGFYHF